MKSDETLKLVAKLSSAHVHLIGKVNALEIILSILWKESGRDIKDLENFLEKEASEANEKYLLKLGDAHPEWAQIADILKQLEKDSPP